ncbi:tRNA guanosine(34) transglycosylase Tgt [Candidatus Parcubacteria bacterium 4484_255]|nr:MAG: tRNA guanosine(34) transglycosylase Tgt [Candidatus Parcubacteria bacterium 4484_255]
MFKIIKKSNISQARLAELKTKHGIINTPFFMPIATQGTIKGLTISQIKDLNAQILLSNTYHLFLRPGLSVIKKAGGLHRFMGWRGPILTDSGGYQVFSLSKKRKVSDMGVEFQSDIDGKTVFLSPSRAIKIQNILGSDIVMSLDECPVWPCPKAQAEKAVRRTSAWAKICKATYNQQLTINNQQLLFGIVQGSIYKDLRAQSAKRLVNIGFDGYAIGGLMLGESIKETYKAIQSAVQELPLSKPRYLMGAGKPEQIIEAVKMGIDMFDCVIPTRNARHGVLYINSKSEILNPKQYQNSKFQILNKNFYKKIHITNAKYKNDFKPLDANCSCYACQNFSRAYIRHLFMAKEQLGKTLATIHNLAFYLSLMKDIRIMIKKGKL